MNHQLAVFFPGMGYTCQEKLIQGCIKIYQEKGYEIRILDFGKISFSDVSSFSQAYQKTQPLLKRELLPWLGKSYDDLVFVSKSFGTLCACQVDRAQGWKARHLLLTPLPETLDLIEKETEVIAMVIGSEDRYLDPVMMQRFCDEHAMVSLLFEGTGHRLKYPQDEGKTERLNRRVFELCL